LSAISRTPDANGDRRARRGVRRATISSFPNSGAPPPYGVYDIANNVGWVSVGIDHDTAGFRGQRHSKLVEAHGRERYPSARSLLITADGGGSNGSRVRLWKIELQKLADELGVPITVCPLAARHQPNGTRSCIASSLSSPETGAANPSSAIRSSSS